MAEDPGRSDPKDELNFEKTLETLETVVETLESGKLGLSEALAYFQEGIRLVKDCNRYLEEAELRITELLEDAAGNITEKHFGLEEDGG